MKRIPLLALIGLAITTAYFLAAIFAPLIAPYPMGATPGGSWQPASAQFWLGTDSIGRDLLSRLIWGGRITIAIATVFWTRVCRARSISRRRGGGFKGGDSGTDLPFGNAAADAAALAECGFTEADVRAIERENAVRLLPRLGAAGRSGRA